MSRDEQQIRELVTTWMEASQHGDTATVLGLMTEDVVFLRPGAPPMAGRDSFAKATEAQGSDDGEPPVFEGTSEIREIEVDGDHAYAWTELTVVTTPPGGGPKTRRSGHTLSVFRREGGRWLLARDANLLGPPEEA